MSKNTMKASQTSSDWGKKYFVQCKEPDGTISLSVNTAREIINFVGFRDCSECGYAVYAADEFGELVKLEEVPQVTPPYNYHTFLNPKTGETEFSGFSVEH